MVNKIKGKGWKQFSVLFFQFWFLLTKNIFLRLPELSLLGRVSQTIWTAAIQYVINLLSRMPSRVLGFKTPLQTLAAHVPIYSHLNLTLYIFGCVGYVHLNKSHQTKLYLCARRCVFVSFAPQQKSYQCYHPSSCLLYVPWMLHFWRTRCFYVRRVQSCPLEDTVKETHNWFEMKIQGEEAQNSALKIEQLSWGQASSYWK